MLYTFTMQLKFRLILSFLLISFYAVGERNYIKHEIKDDGQIAVYVSDGVYEISYLNIKTIRISFDNQEKPDSDKVMYAIQKTQTNQAIIVSDSENEIIIDNKALHLTNWTAPKLRVKITKQPFVIEYIRENETVLTELNASTKANSNVELRFGITKDEILYGGGARVLGMNRRGNKLELYNRAHYGYTTRSELMNYSMPMVVSSNLYSIIIDNPAKGILDLDSDKTNSIKFSAVGGPLVYYITSASSWYELCDLNTQLTGRQPMIPRWALGNFSSRFGYHSQEEVLNTIEKFNENDIPVDAIILDIYWFGKGVFDEMGNLDWYRDSFPEPEKMLDKLKSQGVNPILITEPFILTTSNRWQEAVDEGVLGLDSIGKPYKYNFFFGNTGLIDIFKPEAKDWFWNIYKKFTLQCVEGWWGDLGEPEVHPDDLIHVNGTAAEVHNAYGHEWTRLVYEGFKKDFPNKRPFILMRAGFVGTQRYGIIPWTGDVSRSWGGLKPQVEISLQMGMQGIAYMHSDLGGFAGGEVFDPELYIRWLQYGVFQPIFRPHAQEQIAPEPVFHDQKTIDLARKAIKLRYKLLPYNYNLVYENSKYGRPLMKPLFFDETENKKLLTYDNAYMWGNSFLVAPIKDPGVKTKELYLPKFFKWFDFHTDEVYEGGQTITISTNEEYIPVFVRSGSFIPMSKSAGNTSNYSLESFELHYYHSEINKYEVYDLYNDDGFTPDSFKKGKFELFTFYAIQRNGNLIIEAHKDTGYQYDKTKNQINLVIHGIKSKPKKIKGINSKYWSYDPASMILTIKTSLKKKFKHTIILN